MTGDDSRAPSEMAVHEACGESARKPFAAASLDHIAIELEEELAKAHPRLLRLAVARGVAPDAIDDVVQETLLEAWQYLERLRSPEQLHDWLDGICRNVCRRWQQRQQRLQARHVPLLLPIGASEQYEDQPTLDLPDSSLLDPAEELERQDLEILLDRALAHLSPENRRAIECCYLLELPQRETALRLGMTISALEGRLHRARQQLQRVLTGELREDAAAFGLTMKGGQPGDETGALWRESREWCIRCGKHRLVGRFIPQFAGNVLLMMRCPECYPRYDSGAVLGFLPAGEWRSFRPAIKRTGQWFQEHVVRRYQQGLPGLCERCGAENIVQIMRNDEYIDRFVSVHDVPPEHAFVPHFVFRCTACSFITIGMTYSQAFTHPIMQRFTERHPRSIVERLALAEYAGFPVLHLRLADLASAARISAFIHLESAHVLAVIDD